MSESSYWRGRRLDALSKEELIDAVEWLGKRYHEVLESRAEQRIEHMRHVAHRADQRETWGEVLRQAPYTLLFLVSVLLLLNAVAVLYQVVFE